MEINGPRNWRCNPVKVELVSLIRNDRDPLVASIFTELRAIKTGTSCGYIVDVVDHTNLPLIFLDAARLAVAKGRETAEVEQGPRKKNKTVLPISNKEGPPNPPSHFPGDRVDLTP